MENDSHITPLHVFRRVMVNGEVIAGEDIAMVSHPTNFLPFWTIYLCDGQRIYTTGKVSVFELPIKKD